MKRIFVAVLALVMLCSVMLCTPASATATATLKVGSTSSDETMSVTLTCSANGTLS